MLMSPDFILWSATMGGWFTKSATYSSEYRDAQRFTFKDALSLIHAHRRDGRLGLIPVRVEDVENAMR